MPRRPQIRYFTSRQGYYCQIARRQHRLASGPDDYPNGPTYREAAKVFAELVEQTAAPRNGQRNRIRTICNLFLDRHKNSVAPGTFLRWQTELRPFIRAEGDRLIAHFGHATLNAFIEQQRRPHEITKRTPQKLVTVRTTWGDEMVYSFTKLIVRIMKWARERGLLDADPLAGYELPPAPRRRRHFLVSAELHQEALALCTSRLAHYRPLLVCLEATGARQSELLAAEARYWDSRRQALVYKHEQALQPGDFRHKAAKHKDRFIYFTGEALEEIQRLMRKHPTGPLFRNNRGQGIKTTQVFHFFSRLQDVLGAPGYTSHAYRHTFVTRWLESNPNIDILAQLIGDEPATLRRYYSHLCDRWEGVRSSLEAFRNSLESAPAPAQAGQSPASSDVLPSSPSEVRPLQ